LVGLNDEACLDMIRQFSSRLESAAPKNPKQQITIAYERATGHAIEAPALASLMNLYDLALQKYNTDKNGNDVCEMAGVHLSKEEMTTTAALVVVINAIMNLDEVITKN